MEYEPVNLEQVIIKYKQEGRNMGEEKVWKLLK